MPYKDKEKEREHRRLYCLLNRDAIRERKRRNYLRNRGIIREKRKRHYAHNCESIKERQRQYRINNADVVRLKDRVRGKSGKRKRAVRDYYAKNRGKILSQKVEYDARTKKQKSEYRKKYKDTLIGRIVIRLNNLKRKNTIRLVSDGSITKKEIIKMMQAQGCKCVYCPQKIQDNFHIDHKTPLSRGGRHTLSNAQLLCPPCNIKKRDKTHEEFLAILSIKKL